MDSMVFKRKWPLFVFLVPAFLFMVVFLYYPFALNIINSFQDIVGLGTDPSGVNSPWYKNYVTVFTDPIMRTSMINTLWMIVATIVFQVGLALVLAMMVDSIRKGAQFYRTVFFFPIVISATAIGLMFNLIDLYNGGMINQFLALFGVAPVDWKDPAHALPSMFIPVVWQYVGFYFVIIVTGLKSISTDIYEAAQIDGAEGFDRIRYITLPLLHNVLCTCLVLAITGALKVFDLPWVMFPRGLPMNTTYLTGTYMYYQTFQLGDVDYGSAIAVVIVVLGVVLSQFANKIFKQRDY